MGINNFMRIELVCMTSVNAMNYFQRDSDRSTQVNDPNRGIGFLIDESGLLLPASSRPDSMLSEP